MPMWRCPHCGTPQAETARCWVCRRSSTTCSTCRHFRRSVAAQLGYCGLDRRRLPLAGTELRGCWEAGAVRAADAAPGALPAGAGGIDVDDRIEPPSAALRLRGFVPVELASHRAARQAPRREQTAALAAPEAMASTSADPDPVGTWADRVTLFADAEL
ncbi:MAG TPA: hypothetical protein VFX65_09480 [Candidatus Limnocylindrales bacterium]|nr:hypothetical protein [Candidatus Limnocylindrales bacterium]